MYNIGTVHVHYASHVYRNTLLIKHPLINEGALYSSEA